MIDRPDSEPQSVIAFGPFRLTPAKRLLEKADAAVPVGGRALDILVALVERAGETVSKRDLIERVWLNVTVDEGSLRFHVAALRKALGDGQPGGARYIANAPGRGYCFVAPVSRATAQRPPISEGVISDQLPSLPGRLTRMVGRDAAVRTISAQLNASRFVTIVGPGGIGKTTVAVSVAHALLAEFRGMSRFVDLGTISDPGLVATALTTALNIPAPSDPISSLIDFLKGKRILLVLDSCEHVIDAASLLAKRISGETGETYLLATSRQRLGVAGEQVHRLSPLDCPPEDLDLTAAAALDFPAVQLFVERVAATADNFALSDADAPIVADICRRLDGIALAIEFAAGRVSSYGLREVAAALNSRIGLMWRGRRTALPRHRTLRATLDWSYDLLSEFERAVVRRLSVLVGPFTLEAARSVATGGIDRAASLEEAVASLVEKSLISCALRGGQARYRLLDTTRAYAREKLLESGEMNDTARRLALYCLDFLKASDPGPGEMMRPEEIAAYAEQIGNLRAALEWSFSPGGDARTGIALAAARFPLLMSMSHVEESRRWSQAAIAALDGTSRGGRIEMRLQTLLGLSVIVAPGFANEGRIALTRALEIAEKLGDFESQLMLLGHLNNFAMVTLGDYRAAHDFALRCARIEEGLDRTAVIRADSKLGSSYRYIGDLERAERHIRAALTRAAQRRASGSSNDSGVTTYLCDLASILWLRGHADQATEIGSRILEEVLDLGYPFVACIYLAGIIPYFIWIGDERLTTSSIERMLEITDTANFAGFRLQALAFKGAQLIGRGDSQEGIPLIRNALDDLPNALIKPISSPLVAILANGLAGTGQNQAAIAALDKEIARIERDGDLIFMPDILRAKADILASMPDPDIPGAEDCLLRSLDLAGRQSALSWELRAATSLARLRHRQGQPDEARKILAPIFGRFTEGFDTLDLRTARRLLDELT